MGGLLGLGYEEELVILLGSVVLVSTMGVVMLAVLIGITMMMRIKTISGDWMLDRPGDIPYIYGGCLSLRVVCWESIGEWSLRVVCWWSAGKWYLDL